MKRSLSLIKPSEDPNPNLLHPSTIKNNFTSRQHSNRQVLNNFEQQADAVKPTPPTPNQQSLPVVNTPKSWFIFKSNSI